MTQFTALEASKETGVSKSTITRAIKAGKLSAAKDENGVFRIDAAELFRVYPPSAEKEAASSIRDAPLRTDAAPHHAPDHDAQRLTREIEIREQRIEEISEERRRERENAQAHIDDLRKQLDEESEQRRALTRLLTDQNPQERKGFWGLFRRTG